MICILTNERETPITEVARGFMSSHNEISSESMSDMTIKKAEVADFWDKFGIAVSFLCLIHCIAMPVILILAPTMLAVGIFQEDTTHKILIGFVILAGVLSLIPGYLLHKDMRPLILGSLGVGLMGFATFGLHQWLGHEWEALIAIPASALLIYAHYRNRKNCKVCAHHHGPGHQHH
jgi:hypothetical protein